ncbi:unnamed protein product, partial [Rotaria sp. Silwood2]
NLLTSYDDRPKTPITEQTLDESAQIIRGHRRGKPVWIYVLVPVSKLNDLKIKSSSAHINLSELSRSIKYLDNGGKIKRMRGKGFNAPKMLRTWVEENYDSASIDENISLVYEKDDIRLCTMQNAISKERLGFSQRYHRKERFHYIKFLSDCESSLAYRAGIKNFDRIIEINGVNIEKNTPYELRKLVKTVRHLPFQILVCSSATFIHYRSNGKLLHSDLPTVQHLKPVFATPKCYHPFSGSYDDCEQWTTDYISTIMDSTQDHNADFVDNKFRPTLDGKMKLSLQNSSQKLETDTMTPEITIQDSNNDIKVRQNANNVELIQDRSRFVLPRQLVRDVFSNKFPSLHHVNLGRIHNSTCSSWATSPSLQSVSILYSTATSTLAILASCPNLHHFQVYTFYTNTKIFTTSAPLNHPLRRLTLWSNYTELTFNDIDNLLLHTPNIEYLYVQTVYRTSFIHLADGLINRLHYLSRFDCYIREMLTTDDRIGDLNSVHRMHPCFYRIHCIKQNDRYRIFATNH